MSASRRLRFAVPMRIPIGPLHERTGWLIEGPSGWGEWSPLPSWSTDERQAGLPQMNFAICCRENEVMRSNQTLIDIDRR